jgi:hypothetical protein
MQHSHNWLDLLVDLSLLLLSVDNWGNLVVSVLLNVLVENSVLDVSIRVRRMKSISIDRSTVFLRLSALRLNSDRQQRSGRNSDRQVSE